MAKPRVRGARRRHRESSEAPRRDSGGADEGEYPALGIFDPRSLEHAQQIAGHASPKTTKLYDRTADTVTVDEIERIVI